MGVTVEGARPKSPERPSRSFKDVLTKEVLFPPVNTVPVVPVALDGEAAAHALDHQIDAVVSDLDLRAD